MTSPSPSGRGRTVVLSLIVVLAVIILAAVGFLVFRSGSPNSGTDRPSATPTTVTTTSEESETISSPKPTPTRTTPRVEPGSVTYQLTGDGDVVALAYRDSGGRVVVAATGTPWSAKTVVPDREVEMTAIVVRGPVTCTILQGDDMISSSTSRGGPLRCAGRLPR
ncbi:MULTISPECIES: hypothetical protein [Gordonia]|uniref:MmpS family membrane protein n=1 Tax=Gordonia cholesterolivorans TaxID=559625 RepID=A0ABN3HRD5_9ACTN|nr:MULTISPECIES: hypothetical protein [Gordonia]WFN93098.1 hypothetical protein P5P27_00480 [Gordonia sihwensis]